MVNRQEFRKKAMLQYRGGLSGDKGVAFQLFSSAVELAKFAAASKLGPLSDVLFISQARHSRVDDLHVVFDRSIRWRYQIKADEDLCWDAVLRAQFTEEREVYPHSQLFLTVHDEGRARAMAANREDHGLSAVRILLVPYRWMPHAFQVPEIRGFLDGFSTSEKSDAFYASMWSSVLAVWVMNRRGRLSELMTLISEASRGTLRTFGETSKMMEQRVNELRKCISNLRFQAVDGTIVMSDGVLRTIVPLPCEWSPDNAEFWSDFPTNEWELYDKLDGFRKELQS